VERYENLHVLRLLGTMRLAPANRDETERENTIDYFVLVLASDGRRDQSAAGGSLARLFGFVASIRSLA